MKVSVVLGIYNNKDTIENTIQSVLNQNFTDFEIVVVNDGSDLKTTQLLSSIAQRNEKIVLIEKTINEGLTKALIEGCDKARGTYIARIDNGDIMTPRDRLTIQAAYLDEHDEAVVVGGKIEIVDMLNGDVYHSIPLYSDNEIRTRMHERAVFAHMAVMFRKSSYEQCGGYTPSCYVGQDADLWPRMLAFGGGVNLPVIFAIAPMSKESISVKLNNRQIIWKLFYDLKSINTIRFKISEIFMAGIKLCIPLKYRVRFRYRRRMEYVGKYDPSKYVANDR